MNPEFTALRCGAITLHRITEANFDAVIEMFRGFEDSGCFVSNTASRRSIEKTPGFQFECVAREHSRNDQGEFEDNYLYAILRRDWERLYDKSLVEVI